MVRILLEVFILAFSLVFSGCSICKIKIEKLIDFCADIEWLFKSYEERIEYSLRPFLDIIKGDFKEYQKLREKIFTFLAEIKLSGKQEVGEEDIENFLKKFFDHDIIEEGAYVFAKEQVKGTLNDLNNYHLLESIDFQMARGKCLENETVEKCINRIVFSIYIAKDTIEKKNEKSLEFIRELNKLYESEHGEVGGFVKLQQRKSEGNYNDSVYNIDELYRIFGEFYNEKSNAGVNIQAEALADAVVKFYKGEEVDKKKQIEMFTEEIVQVCKDIPRTYPNFREYFKEQEKYDEFKKILSKMLFFALFCIRVINEKEGSPSFSANDKIKELSGMKGLGEKQKDDIYKQMKSEPTSFTAYFQGLNFFAGFFVTLYFIVNQNFGGNVNKEEIIDGRKEITDESKIIKLFVFYLLHKWDCDSSVNYLPPCSLYDICVPSLEMPIFILLRRCKLLHVYTNYDFNNYLLHVVFSHMFFSYCLSKTEDNDFLDYIMYLDLHLYIVKKKILTFILIGLIFYIIRLCILLRKRIWNIMVMVLILK